MYNRFHNNRFHNNQIAFFQNQSRSFQNLVSDVVEKLVGISFNFSFHSSGVEITIYESPTCLVKVKFNQVIRASISFGNQSGLVTIESNCVKSKSGLNFESNIQLPYGEFGLHSPSLKYYLLKDIIENGSIAFSILPGELQIEVIIENKYQNLSHNGVIDIRIISKLNNNLPPSRPQPMTSQNDSREVQPEMPPQYMPLPAFNSPFSNPHSGFGGSPGFGLGFLKFART